MEEEVFFLAEHWHVDPAKLMDLPSSRRRRFVFKKIELEKKRQADMNTQASRARARARRR